VSFSRDIIMKKSGLVLLVVGLLQMTGDILDQAGLKTVGQTLKGFGAATTASPAPKVFSAVRGLETYSTRFYLEWTDRAGRPRVLRLTPEVCARMRGPYNRRNVYGAALAYGPVLASAERTQPMFRSVMRYAMCGKAPLLVELGVNPAEIEGRVRVRYEALSGSDLGDLPRILEAPCP
jgi:hypothetical protein